MRQEDLARMVGVAESAIADWERDAREPTLQNMARLADALNTTVDDLLADVERPVRPAEAIPPGELARVEELYSFVTLPILPDTFTIDDRECAAREMVRLDRYSQGAVDHFWSMFNDYKDSFALLKRRLHDESPDDGDGAA